MRENVKYEENKSGKRRKILKAKETQKRIVKSRKEGIRGRMRYRKADIFTHTHTHTHIYIYIYIEGERETETKRERWGEKGMEASETRKKGLSNTIKQEWNLKGHGQSKRDSTKEEKRKRGNEIKRERERDKQTGRKRETERKRE